ncbi:MAG: glycoside hydrolase family 3 C-terminal domain-containing protein [Actinomycetota bacterium]|nr:glycoside hydrolase family 3 C-terminal domain-containing protein [Actinomycetota bacterium]
MTLDIDALLTQLTVTEKASLTSGSGFWWTTPIERLGIPRIMVSDGPHGLRAQLGEGDHVGLGGSLPATCFPTASAVASSWNPDLLHRIGIALGREARACNLSVVLGPGINMKRSPLCGRNFEYLSEDPYLAGELAVGIVDGIQSQGVGTSLKHFAVNNQETDRLRVDAQVDERTLREIYLPAFERVVKAAAPWTVMCSYNKVNGLSASENSWLLTTVLRDEWGYRGLVVSDWGAVYDRVPALRAGLDLEMPPALGRSPEAVAAAVESGELASDALDARVRTVLELVDRGTAVLELDEAFDQDAHHALAREAAAESVVLLKNDGVLPLSPAAPVALIGELARTPRFQGAGSSQVNPTTVDVVLDELTAVYGSVPFAAGYRLDDRDDRDDRDHRDHRDDAELRAEAVEVARSAGTVVLLMGLPAADESEGFDRTHMDLPANQRRLLHAVACVNPRVVVVLVNGSTVLLDEVTPYAAALVEAWLGGQAAGSAIVDVLSGRVNPSGRLAESIPLRLEDNPSFLSFPGDSHVVRYGEGLHIGYRGYDRTRQEVAFPFGFGLSYTAFGLSDLTITVAGDAADGTLVATVGCSVTNTGSVEGAEVVQVYVGDPESSVDRPVRELKGFAKVHLLPNQTERVTLVLDQRAFSFWSVRHHDWVVEAGTFTIGVGTSSRDLPLSQTICVDAPAITEPLTRDSTLHEWVTDPIGRQVLEEAAGAGAAMNALSDELVGVIGSMPMSTLASFGGMSLGHEALDRAVSTWQARRWPAD